MKDLQTQAECILTPTKHQLKVAWFFWTGIKAENVIHFYSNLSYIFLWSALQDGFYQLCYTDQSLCQVHMLCGFLTQITNQPITQEELNAFRHLDMV